MSPWFKVCSLVSFMSGQCASLAPLRALCLFNQRSWLGAGGGTLSASSRSRTPGASPFVNSTPAATERGRIAKGRVAAIASRLYRSDSPRVLALVCSAPHDVLAAWDAEHEQVRTSEGQRR